MYDMMKVQKFHNNLDTYESKDLSFLFFADIDFSNDVSAKSFYRADFRRSKISNCNFYKNAFGRADFVDVYIQNSSFDNVNWGACLFKNSNIISSIFKNNSYKGISLQFNTFKDCTFKEEHFVFNAYKCKFIKCTFEKCTFEKSSLEDITFECCIFNDVNIAECHSENLKFDSCKVNSLKLGITYWSTYLFKYTKIDECTFMYKGEIIDVSSIEYFGRYMDVLLQQDRLYEFLNCIIINNKNSKNVVPAFCYVWHRIEKLPRFIRNKNIIDILEMLQFYHGYMAIGYEEYNSILVILNNQDWNDYSFEDANVYMSKVYQLNRTFDNCIFPVSYLSTIDLNSTCEIVIRLNFDKEADAIKYIDDIFGQLNLILKSVYAEPLYTTIKTNKGSIVLTISSFLLLGILLSYTYKKIAHNNEVVRFERSLSENLKKRLSEDNISISEVKKICSVAKENNLTDSSLDIESIKNFSKEITTGEIISIILKVIS